MAIVQKGIRVRLYPTEEQEILINKTLGCVRLVHNQTLSDCKQSYEQTQHFPPKNERITNLVRLKETYVFLKEVDSTALQQSVRDLNSSLDNFFKNRNHFGFPKFKSKHNSKQSYRTPHNNGAADVLDNKHLKLPKLGRVKTKRFNVPEAYKIFNITVERTNTGKYYASICIETEVQPLPKTGKQLLAFIQYKCQWYEKRFVQVDRFYASSKICSECGTYHKDIVNSLKVREWICPDCGTHHDRDINAAKNILIKALSVGV